MPPGMNWRRAPLRSEERVRRNAETGILERMPAYAGKHGADDVADRGAGGDLGVGGRLGRMFRDMTARQPFVCHGLSLSIGGPSPLDETFLHRLKAFLDDHGYGDPIAAYFAGHWHLDLVSELYEGFPVVVTAATARSTRRKWWSTGSSM